MYFWQITQQTFAHLILGSSHEIQGTAGLEPGDLAFVESVVDLDVHVLPISLVDTQREGLAGLEPVVF